MTRERLTKELEKVRLQIAKLQEKEKTLAAEKEKAGPMSRFSTS